MQGLGTIQIALYIYMACKYFGGANLVNNVESLKVLQDV